MPHPLHGPDVAGLGFAALFPGPAQEKPALPEEAEETPADMAEPAVLPVAAPAKAPATKAGGAAVDAAGPAQQAPVGAGPSGPVVESEAATGDPPIQAAEPGRAPSAEPAPPLPLAEAVVQPGPAAPPRLAGADLPHGSLAILRPAVAVLGAAAGQLPADTDLRMDLTVETEGIGPIRFIMESAGDVIRVQLVAQQADALDLLRRHVADLQAGLQQAGYREAQMSFGDWQGKAPPPPPQPVADIQAEPVPARLPSLQTVAAVAVARGGLDMRW